MAPVSLSLCLQLALLPGVSSATDAAPPAAEVPAVPRPSELPRWALEDARALRDAPRAETPAWRQAGLALAVLGAAYALDRTVDEVVLRNRRDAWDRGARGISQLGGVGGLTLAGAAYAGGWAADVPELQAFGADALLAVAFARGLALPLKAVVGRARPDEDCGTHHLHPLHGDAFPSGHAAQAFALAAVCADRCESTWTAALAYGVAGLVGVSRLELRRHFLSDVVAGALLGTGVAKVVLHQHRRMRASARGAQVSLAPLLGPRFQGLAVGVRF